MKDLTKNKTADGDQASNTPASGAEDTMNAPLSRRRFIRWGATGLGVAATLPLFGGSAEAAHAVTSGAVDRGITDKPDTAEAARERAEVVQAAADDALGLLVAPIAAGSKLGEMRVESVRVDNRGVGLVELNNGRGRNYLAEICRRNEADAKVRPLASTRKYSVYLYNNGSGDVPTDEKVGQAVLAIGARLKANEEKVEILALRSRKELWQAEGYLG